MSRLFDAIEFQPPEHWQMQTMYTFAPPMTAPAPGSNPQDLLRREQLVALRFPRASGVQLEFFVKQQMAMAQGQLPGFTVLEQQSITIGGCIAFRVSQRMIGQGGVTMEQTQYFIEAPNWIYLFAALAPEGHADGLQALRQRIEQLRFLDRPVGS